MCDKQNCFIQLKSTSDAILEMKEWSQTWAEKYVLKVLLDISGAFDNAWWPAVLHHLKRLGCDDRTIKITRDYLVGREARSLCQRWRLGVS